MDPARVVDVLLRERPSFHTNGLASDVRRVAGAFDWSIGEDVLRWFAATLRIGWRTLETGCGYSTVVFAATGCRHTTISPDPLEHDAVRTWCDGHGVRGNVEFLVAGSQDVVHALPPDPLDLVLIDGDHAFPVPFIDWYYTAERLRPGGLLLVDDTQLPTGAILRSFLCREEGRWRHEGDLGKTALFRRVTDAPVTRGRWWGEQPWSTEPAASTPMARFRAAVRELLGRPRVA